MIKNKKAETIKIFIDEKPALIYAKQTCSIRKFKTF
jgi:hypothetical protein